MSVTPNQMPKRKVDPIHTEVLVGLTAISPVKSTYKRLVTDENGKETVAKTSKVRPGVRYPLAQNVSEENVNRAAKRWIA